MEDQKQDFRWWVPEQKMPERVAFVAYDFIRKNDGVRGTDDMKFMRLYGNSDILGLTPNTFAKVRTNERVALNVIKATSDTVTARVAKARPRPVFLTSGGNWSLQKRARLLEKYVEAGFYTSKVYCSAPRAFLDSCVFGTGILKTYRIGEEIVVERTFPGEVFVDQAEGMYGEPRSIYQRKFITKDQLKSMFPGETAHNIIRRTQRPKQDGHQAWAPGWDTTADQVEVLMCWHLPSGKDSGDGKYLVCTREGILAEEEWDKDYFPFTFIRWNDRLLGFWGTGLAQELTGLQIEINRLLVVIQRAMKLLGVPMVFLEKSSKIQTAHINNQIGAIVPYSGTPPIIRPNQTVHPETFSHLNYLYTKAFEISGVSLLSATSLKPSGLESGKALREFNDIETERFAIVSRNYEQMFMDIAMRMVDLGRDIAEENPEYKVVANKDKHTIQEVKWSDVDMDRDAYVLKVFPSSSLPSTPAGRLATVEHMLTMGMVDIPTGKALLDFPDLERDIALDRAAADNIERVIEQMLDDGVWESPEPFQDHQLALKKCQAAYNRAIGMDVPEDRLEHLRRYMLATHEMLRRSQLQPAAPAGIMSAAGAAPEPSADGAPVTSPGPEQALPA